MLHQLVHVQYVIITESNHSEPHLSQIIRWNDLYLLNLFLSNVVLEVFDPILVSELLVLNVCLPLLDLEVAPSKVLQRILSH